MRSYGVARAVGGSREPPGSLLALLALLSTFPAGSGERGRLRALLKRRVVSGGERCGGAGRARGERPRGSGPGGNGEVMEEAAMSSQ